MMSILCSMQRIDQSRHPTHHSTFRNLALLGVPIVLGAAAWATIIEPRMLLVRKIDLAIPSLPAEISGSRLAFLSDFHLGGPGDPVGSACRALSVLQKERPDLILLGGDYYDRGTRVEDEIDWGTLSSIAPTYAVPGNHDYQMNPAASAEIFNTLSGVGITVLRNETINVPLHNGTLQIVGLDDPFTGRADYDRAVTPDIRQIAPRILLAHAGLIADQLPVGAADLILSGHTHNGQVRISPFRRTTPLDSFWWMDRINGNPISPYRQGLIRVRGSLLYIGNGLGTTSLGIRFLAPPEIAIFTLIAGDGHPDLDCDDPDRYVLRYESKRTW